MFGHLLTFNDIHTPTMDFDVLNVMFHYNGR